MNEFAILITAVASLIVAITTLIKTIKNGNELKAVRLNQKWIEPK